MKCFIKGQEYTYINDILEDMVISMSYFQLAKQIFGLEFEKWYQPDHWDNRFIPYVIMHEDMVISGAAVCINDISWFEERKRYVQISTVMTLPEYRNNGLGRYLMEAVLNDWKDKCDAIYLLANDAVVNFYPQFGFEAFKEFQYSKPVSKSNGIYRKLDIDNPDDWHLLIEKYMLGNPFSALTVENKSQFIFHCIRSFSKDVYYVDKYDAVAIFRFEGDNLTCYDIFTDGNFRLDDLLNIIATESTKVIYLGFTPKLKEGYIIEESREPDTHLFVLKGKENIFKDNQVMFPILSRA
jgi:predicted GNAT family N-acyltransferase